MESYHSDFFLADEYKGTVSVYGLEEITQDIKGGTLCHIKSRMYYAAQ